MGKLVISIAGTVDGIVDDFGWYVAEGEHEEPSRDQFRKAGAYLLGRKTYEGLAGFWPTQQGPWADVVNPMPKLVASRTLSEPLEWNARLLEGELDEAVPRLKEETEGDVIVSGSGELARNLLAAGLVDELRFWMHPVVWGEGEGARLFEGERVRLRHVDSQSFDSGVAVLRYQPLGVG